MANINVVVDKPIADGYKLKFRTPCDSTTIEGLEVKYPANNGVGTLIKKFVFKDAHGTELSGVGNLFVSGVMIEVLLDVTHGVAYIQNADTNSYVESVKSEVQRLEESQRQFLGIAGKVVEDCEQATTAAEQATNTLTLTHDDIVKGGYIKALKEQNAGGKFSFWVGTTDEYNALTEKKNDCFYILTDDMSRNEIITQLATLEEDVTNLKSQTVTDKYYGNFTEPLRFKLRLLKSYLIVVSQLGLGNVINTGVYIAITCNNYDSYPESSSKLLTLFTQPVFPVSLVDTPNNGTELVIENPDKGFLQLSVTEI